MNVRLLLSLVLLLSASISLAEDAPRLKLLFLGDNGHHQPAERFKQLEPAMKARGIDLTYTDKIEDLNPATLREYAGLVVYANIDRIDPPQAKALLEYVSNGGGFVPLHCASYCFRNSDEVVALIGAQFTRHGTGTFRVAPAPGVDHPIVKGYGGFESWDETYVHTKHNDKDRTVLEFRVDREGREPWTWVRTHGKGRVFYTAWGHDSRTFTNAGFLNLVERGIRWAVKDDPAKAPSYADRPVMTQLAKGLKPFDYVEADVPFYVPGKAWGTMDKTPRKMQKPVSPEESMQHMVTPAGFKVELVVSEPELQAKPIFITWDERGRLWICETVDYPNELKTRGEGRDRIRICEDTNGDGKIDRSKIFAEKLSIPTALTFYRGGAVVQNGVETIYLKDTNGDDVADLRKVLVTGWAMNDTHGQVSNFQYGLDNWYYAMQGYNNSEPVLTDGRKVTPFRAGFFRFKMAGDGDKTAITDIEFLRSTNNNTWGLGISEEGLVFGSTANGNPSEFMPIPNRYYEAVRGWSSSVLNGIADNDRFEPLNELKVRQVDHHGGFTAAAGHALYTARNYPRDYWNRAAFVTEPTGHLVATFLLRQDGAGFRSKNSWNLLASDDEWTSPIMAEVGPDGNVWICDWYNFIVQHNPTPAGFKTGKGNAYESSLRDKTHGRIYKLLYSGKRDAQPTPEIKSLKDATPEQLVAALSSDNMFWRKHAQRLIVERGKKDDVASALIQLTKSAEVDPVGLNPSIIHALWAMHGLGLLDGKQENGTYQAAVSELIRHTKSQGVYRNAVQVLPRTPAAADNLLSWEKNRPADAFQPNQQGELALLLWLAELQFGKPEIADFLVTRFQRREIAADRWLLDGLTSAAARHNEVFLVAFARQSGGQPSGDAAAPQAPLLSEPAQRERLRIVAEHFARGGSIDTVNQLLPLLPKMQPDDAAPIIQGVAKGWPKDKPVQLDAAGEGALVKLITSVSADSRGALVNLAARWGSKALENHTAKIAESLLANASDVKTTDAQRVAAAKQLIEFRRSDEKAIASLAELITPRTSSELAVGIVDAIGMSESPAAGATLVERVGSFTPAARQAALRALLSRADWTKLMIGGIEGGKLELSDLSLDQKQALVAHPDKDIADRIKPLLAKGGGLPNADRQKVVDELLPTIQQKGDAVAGKEVFKKTCSKCHTHSGEGTKIGPDLTGMAVHPKHELLIHIIDPSRSVEGNFRIYTVATTEGKVFSGLLSSESKTAIELVDAEAKKHTILREEIEDLVPSKKSLMPEGFEKQHTPIELRNLLEFLTQRGKFLPIPLEKLATAVSTKGMFYSADADAERLIFADWKPKVVEGVPFVLVDPQGDKAPNVIMLHGPQGYLAPKMPKTVSLPCNAPAKAIHLLGGISGWGFPFGPKGSVTMIVRLHYADGKTEDHELKNGEHFADYIRRVDVPGSKFAFQLRGQQVRYLSVLPKRPDAIERIELVKGTDNTAPIVMAVTIEGM